jgi:hypothetical protein
MEVLSDFVEIIEIGGERDVCGLDMRGGASAAALVVVDEAAVVGETVEFGKQIRVVEVRAAMEDYDDGAFADFPGVEIGAVYGDADFARLRDGCCDCRV